MYNLKVCNKVRTKADNVQTCSSVYTMEFKVGSNFMFKF